MVRDQLDDTYHQVQKNARRAKLVAREGVHEARRQIKARPLRSVAAVAGCAFTCGLLAGVIIGRRR